MTLGESIEAKRRISFSAESFSLSLRVHFDGDSLLGLRLCVHSDNSTEAAAA